ncbi:MAG: GTPase ObgE [Lachnospiraceae bacterium]|nr:GTPase ObgE [Lachnospiraceae bacterium]
MFADTAKIFIKSGKGGDGHVSFRRELYVPDGGPNGGDGGKGGDIIFEVDEGLNTLTDFRHKRKYVAEAGEEGGKNNKHGKNGESLVIKVPAGTVIKDDESGKVIADMSGDNKREVILTGGRGGKGNQHYATSTMQAPKYAQPGQDSMELWVRLELKVIADVGLVGFPNVGKSTLLSRVTNAKPKVANYHFTTLNPHLGVVDLGDGEGFVMADIPGLIEGASEGVGLGHDFLRHIERTKVIIHMVDAAGTEGRDPIEDIKKINNELGSYNPELLKLPQVIAANKIDCFAEFYDDDENAVNSNETLIKLKEEFEKDGIKVYPISAVSGKGVNELLWHVNELLKTVDQTPVVFEKEFDVRAFVDDVTAPYTVQKIEDGVFSIEGPRIERMLGYTNLESEKGFKFFQDFMRDNGILQELEDLGIVDGDTVNIYGHSFDYYK